MTRRLPIWLMLACVTIAVAALAGPARAQFVSDAKQAAEAQANAIKNGNPLANGATGGVPVVTFPGANVPPPTQNLTPEQVRQIMMYRALQSRGGTRGQVRTGVPQFVPFGMPGYFPNPQAMGVAGQQTQQQPDAKRTSSRERRMAARKAAEEKKRAAREAAKAKADAKANAKKKAAAAK